MSDRHRSPSDMLAEYRRRQESVQSYSETIVLTTFISPARTRNKLQFFSYTKTFVDRGRSMIVDSLQ